MDSVSRFLTLFTQPWEGDITMTLPLDISMQVSPIVNPQQVDLVRLLKVRVLFWGGGRGGRGRTEEGGGQRTRPRAVERRGGCEGVRRGKDVCLTSACRSAPLSTPSGLDLVRLLKARARGQESTGGFRVQSRCGGAVAGAGSAVGLPVRWRRHAGRPHNLICPETYLIEVCLVCNLLYCTICNPEPYTACRLVRWRRGRS